MQESSATVFSAVDREALAKRLERLQAMTPRQWGKMAPAQMLAHCAVAIELPMADPSRRQVLLGRLFARFVRAKYLGEAPFPKSSPTDPAFLVADERDLAAEKARLLAALARFAERGAAGAEGTMHSFFGRLSGEEWGRLIYKHLDHHLRQFGL